MADVQRIGGLVAEIESIADPAVRAAAKGLMQSLMDLHGAALEKTLDIVAEAGDSGMNIIDRLGCDPLVSSVLILYGLHPADLEARVTKAVDSLRPQLRKQGCGWKLARTLADRLGKPFRRRWRQPSTMPHRIWLHWSSKVLKRSRLLDL